MNPESVITLPQLPARAPDAHKGNFGHVLVVAGSRGMAGAAVLCGSAALRGGAGTVQVAAPDEVQPTIAAAQICCTTAALPSNAEGQLAAAALPELLRLAQRATVLAIGPGLGQSASVSWVVRGLLEKTAQPVVLDADGVNALTLGSDDRPLRPSGATILTPHPGEFARLTGATTAEVLAARESLTVRWAARLGAVVLLKGAKTLVSDGRRLYVNRTGNPGMATGGSGDVLTGLIAALAAQGLGPFEAAQLGAHLHGLAGDLARDELGEVSLIASDLLGYLPRALVRLRTA